MSSCEIIRMPRSQRKIRISSEEYRAGGPENVSAVIKGTGHEEMLQSFNLVSEEKVREAFEHGIEEGSRRTTELLQDQYSERITLECQRINQVLGSIQRTLSSQSGQTEQALFAFAVGVAEHIIRREITQDKEILVNIMKDGIRKIVGVEQMKVRLNPSDLNYIQENKHTIQSVSDSLREITFEPDPSVEQGGCTIESDIGNVDARISTQLEQVKELIGKHS